VSDRSRLRLVVLQAVVLSLLLTLLGRLWYLQIRNGAEYQTAATNNQVRQVVTEAVRGQILDDQGRALVRNRTSLVISVDRSALFRQKKPVRDAVLARLAKQLNTTALALSYKIELCGPDAHNKPPICWNGSPYQPIPVARDVSQAVALSILEHAEDYPGVSADLEAVREYPAPYGANAAHELGYIGPVSDDEVTATESTDHPLYRSDLIGRGGLESEYDAVLRGVNGVRQVAVDRAGNVTGTLSETDPVPGGNLVTNLDARVQAVLEQQLNVAMDRARSQKDKNGKHYVADSAAGVVMDVRTGAIIAMASVPTYNPSIWVGGISTKEYDALTSKAAGQPLISRAYQSGFAPGSTFKVVSSSAMLQNGYSEAGPYPCPSNLKVADRTFDNSESKSYGPISLERAVEVSCDTVFYGVAYDEWKRDGAGKPVRSPRDIFINAALAWRFGTKTGVDLPAEAAGHITTRQTRYDSWVANKATYCANAKTEKDPYLRAIAADNCDHGNVYLPGDAVNFVIGQGETLTTPLKMAQVYAAVANGGTLWEPQLAKAVLSPTGQVTQVYRPVAQGKLPISRSTLQFLQTSLAQVTVSGTADNQFKDFPLNQIPVAAKTGTAEVAGKQTTSWFATYAPANKPEYAVVMMVSQGGFGSTTSADSVKAIYQALFGVNGKTVDPKLSILPGGKPPTKLPVVSADGRILPPGTVLPKTTPAQQPAAGGTSPTTPTPGTPSGTSALPPALPASGFSEGRRDRGGGT
jgi:penicillin-binding protein 2